MALTKVSGTRRSKTDWAANLKSFVGTLKDNDAWIGAWAADGKWQNYPLMIDNQIVPGRTEELCPHTCHFLKNVRVKTVKVAGFSKVGAGGIIESHTDHQAGSSHGRAAMHVCLTGESWLKVGTVWHHQTPGKIITFDPEVPHEVINDGDTDRIVLYINYTV